jgi:hypothetical protein
MRVPNPRRPAGVQEQQDHSPVIDSPTMITQATTVHVRRLPTPDGTYNTTRIQINPRAQTPSHPKQNSTSGQTLPCLNPVSATRSLRIPQEATPLTLAHVFESQNRFGLDLGQTFASPKPGSNLDIHNRRTPDVIRHFRANTLLKKFFPILSTVSTTTVWATPRQGGSGT